MSRHDVLSGDSVSTVSQFQGYCSYQNDDDDEEQSEIETPKLSPKEAIAAIKVKRLAQKVRRLKLEESFSIEQDNSGLEINRKRQRDSRSISEETVESEEPESDDGSKTKKVRVEVKKPVNWRRMIWE
jgi:hypothetical protein